MALCLPGRASPVTVAAARPSRLAQRRSTMASPAALVAGRRRLGAAVCAAWSHAASRAYPLRVVASSVDHPRRTVRTRAVADVADATAEVRTGGYPFEDIEARWQKHWADNKTFRTPEQIDTSKPKFYALDMFPYPRCAAVRRARPRPDRPPSPTLTLNRPVRSSTSLPSRSQRRGSSRGPPRGYTATDIIARYKRMTGHNVLHPMGWDAFGLPAEQYAIETGTHPRDTTTVNVGRFREQLQALGFSYDWDREVATCDPTYFKWTQWIFLQLLERGLAYQAEVPVNWCPALGTVLANEEVVDGVSERGGHPVIRKPMKQWMLKITAYGDRLLNDLDDLDWPESIKEMQRNWIGRSEGAQLAFDVPGVDGSLEVYTTRPDTLFGATYLVVAPEHPLVDALTSDEQKEAVEEYVLAASRKSDLERTELAKEKTGVFTGTHATHPLTGEDVPVWVADYVLGTYGTGAIMAVPAHDDRDFEFATQFGLPVVQVVQPPEGAEEGACHAGAGKMVNSACDALDVNGMDNVEAGAKVTEWLEAKGIGAKKVNFKLRDWLFARQRYWGEPFPVVYAEGSDEPIPVPLEQLPLTLPETDNFKPSGSGEGPLANVEDWVQTTDPVGGGAARRETNTMPQWAGSCWYYLRFIDPKNENAMVDGSLEKYWMPVDLYVGGAEHAVLHLLYARFWHKVLYDIGAVSTKEPFQRLVSQGMILGEMEYAAFVDADGNYVSAKGKTDGLESVKVAPEDVKKKGDGYVLAADESVKLTGRAHKNEQIARKRGEPRRRRRAVRRGLAPPVRDVHGPAEGDEDVADEGRRGVLAISRQSVPAVREGQRGTRDGGATQGDQRVRGEGDGGDGGDALQHRHRGDDGVHQRGDQVGLQTRGGARTLRAAAKPLCAAPLGGAVE